MEQGKGARRRGTGVGREAAMTTARTNSSRGRYLAFVKSFEDSRLVNGRRTRWPIPGRHAKANTRVAPGPQTLKKSGTSTQYMRWLRPHRWTVALVLGLSFAAEALKMTEPLFMRHIVDQVLLNSSSAPSERLWRLNLVGAVFVGLVLMVQLLTLAKDDRQRL
ncbi:MAG: hypothetical protein AAFY88_28760, partial [Acidobacteriota bacterium]